MKSIPCAYVRDTLTGILTPQPAFGWFAQGLGVAHRKWDGIPYLLLDEEGAMVVYKGVRLDPDEPRPLHFIQASDAGQEPVSGWMRIGMGDAMFMTGLDGLIASGKPIEPGAYELCGPGIKGNHEGLAYPTLYHHDLISYLRCPRQLDEVIAFLVRMDPPGEGIVWRYGDQYCRLTREDVGLSWPPSADGKGMVAHTSSEGP